ncbi:MAG: dihydrolipoyl dehydrogenase [Kiritimatiellae bacterium]|nr:dihydrolipoyl dehydrogenase [Kiritimatiellia bacterium]
MSKFDVVVIGAGPAGYVAAIRAAQLGLKTACIEQWINKENKPVLGGTCLNVGCIPSKALLDSSEHYYQAQHDLSAHGIHIKECTLELDAMVKRKDGIVQKLTQGIEMLFKKNEVTWLKGHGRLISNKQVKIQSRHESHGPMIVEADHIIIATGSVPRPLPTIPIDRNMIVDSTGALEFREVPNRLGIVGGGVIGLEMGSVWSRLGSEVTILEAMEDFLFFVDEQISRESLRTFKKQGLDIKLGALVRSVEENKKDLTIEYEDKEGSHTLTVDRLVVAVGRKPNTEGLIADEVDLYMDESGYIHVDEYCSTSIPNIYAVGDVVRGPMLAHKGSEEGTMVAERIAGHKAQINYETIPWVVYTWPEIAWVGKTEKELKAAAKEYRVGVFPLKANGRALAMEEQTGLVKVISEVHTDEILGVHIFGPFASELITEGVFAMEYKASAEDIARIVHAHPTISEAIHEAALAVDDRALHM